MKYLLFLLPVLITLSSCHVFTGSGNIVTEKRSTGQFTGISAAAGFQVELKTGPVTEVIVESDDNIISHIETEVSDGILKINTKKMNNSLNVHLKVYITAPVINNVTVSAASSFIAKNVLDYAGRLSFNASSASSITAEVNAPEIEASASSSATIKLSGRTKTYNADASSAASLKTADLLSENTRVTASSGANARVHASVSLNANASSGASINYHGAASVQKSTSSSGGSVEKGE